MCIPVSLAFSLMLGVPGLAKVALWWIKKSGKAKQSGASTKCVRGGSIVYRR